MSIRCKQRSYYIRRKLGAQSHYRLSCRLWGNVWVCFATSIPLKIDRHAQYIVYNNVASHWNWCSVEHKMSKVNLKVTKVIANEIHFNLQQNFICASNISMKSFDFKTAAKKYHHRGKKERRVIIITMQYFDNNFSNNQDVCLSYDRMLDDHLNVLEDVSTWNVCVNRWPKENTLLSPFCQGTCVNWITNGGVNVNIQTTSSYCTCTFSLYQ